MLIDQEHDAPQDFDFAIGDWAVRHRRLKLPLQSSDDWEEFEGQSSTRKILGGFGNLEDNLIHLPAGAYRAVALRSWDRRTGNWSIWWLDGRLPGSLDTPVVGKFADGVGLFYAEDMLDGRPIRIRFTWDARGPQPRWEQAFSADGGETWETNWIMAFSRAP
ncbi:MAG TPA: DUF1579 domain-containing protein [Noviherbaspirillum sp.]|uniref:DUF1579 domain-containing protein n=1 Tax=Noviherbaspirillum sp. TaxID=1926288 RepID=UPI002F950F73